MIFSLRSFSRSRSKQRWSSSIVYDMKKREEELGMVAGDDRGPCTSLTVWRKSLLFSCSGFTVIDSKGRLVYRVDNYIGRPQEVVLMDGNGKPILTSRRLKGLRLVDSWLIYDGDACSDHLERSSSTKKQLQQKPQRVYYVKKPINILQANSNKNDVHKSNVLAHVYMVGTRAADHQYHHHHHQRHKDNKRAPAYMIEGSYCQRSCKVVECPDSSNKSRRKVVAEIRRKEAINGCASFGLEVFDLIVWPGFDPALAMALVVLLDQMFT